MTRAKVPIFAYLWIVSIGISDDRWIDDAERPMNGGTLSAGCPRARIERRIMRFSLPRAVRADKLRRVSINERR